MTRSIPDVRLERYRLGELPPDVAAEVERAAAGNPTLRSRLDALDRSDEDIRARYSPDVFTRGAMRSQRRVWPLALAGALAVVVLAVVVVLPRLPGAVSDRVKGTPGGRPSLAVYRRTPNGSERLADGDVARAGDLLRVGYAAAGRTYGVIFSIDGRGTVTLHLPASGDQSASLSGAKTVLLGRAYELDDAPRIERFYFVTSTRPFEVAPIVSAARRVGTAPERLTLPAGFEQATFAVQKEVRK